MVEGDTVTPATTPREPTAGRLWLLTSGSTGRPKQIGHTLTSLTTVSGDLPPRRWLCPYSPGTYAWWQVVTLGLAAPAQDLVVVDPSGLDEWVPAAVEHGVTAASGTPTFWRQSIMKQRDRLGEVPLEQISLGGEPVDQAVLDQAPRACSPTPGSPGSTPPPRWAPRSSCTTAAPASPPRGWIATPRAGPGSRSRTASWSSPRPTTARDWTARSAPVTPSWWRATGCSSPAGSTPTRSTWAARRCPPAWSARSCRRTPTSPGPTSAAARRRWSARSSSPTWCSPRARPRTPRR
ncbi:AMP-binding protein [Nocardioides convexus]|uniref:AMP-binding protein n=1 Tax=Nocardioides convexus TaxID=2712224 RepID=UPI00310151A3